MDIPVSSAQIAPGPSAYVHSQSTGASAAVTSGTHCGSHDVKTIEAAETLLALGSQDPFNERASVQQPVDIASRSVEPLATTSIEPSQKPSKPDKRKTYRQSDKEKAAHKDAEKAYSRAYKRAYRAQMSTSDDKDKAKKAGQDAGKAASQAVRNRAKESSASGSGELPPPRFSVFKLKEYLQSRSNPSHPE